MLHERPPISKVMSRTFSVALLALTVNACKAPTPEKECTKDHVVRAGQTRWGMAKECGQTVEEFNRMQGDAPNITWIGAGDEVKRPCDCHFK